MGLYNEWTYDPARPEVPYYPVTTLPPSSRWRCVCFSDELFLPRTHYLGRRTLPCMGAECGACAQQKPRRKEGFVACRVATTRKDIILRLTEHAACEILRAMSSRGYLRGMVFSASRRGAAPNGFVEITVDSEPYEATRLPDAPLLPLHLSRVWRIDGWEPELSLTEYTRQVSEYLRKFDPHGGEAEVANAG